MLGFLFVLQVSTERVCVWDIPAPIELVLHQHYLARKVFGEMFHTTFYLSDVFARFGLGPC